MSSSFPVEALPVTLAIFKGDFPPETEAILSPVSLDLSAALVLRDANEDIFKPFSDDFD